jgi:hypothetical protein
MSKEKEKPEALQQLIDILIHYMGKPFETAEQTLNHLKALQEKLK